MSTNGPRRQIGADSQDLPARNSVRNEPLRKRCAKRGSELMLKARLKEGTPLFFFQKIFFSLSQ